MRDEELSRIECLYGTPDRCRCGHVYNEHGIGLYSCYHMEDDGRCACTGYDPLPPNEQPIYALAVEIRRLQGIERAARILLPHARSWSGWVDDLTCDAIEGLQRALEGGER